MTARLFLEVSVSIGAMQCMDAAMLLWERGRMSLRAIVVSVIELLWAVCCAIALLANWVEGLHGLLPIAFLAYCGIGWFYSARIARELDDPTDFESFVAPRGALYWSLGFGVAYAGASWYAMRDV